MDFDLEWLIQEVGILDQQLAKALDSNDMDEAADLEDQIEELTLTIDQVREDTEATADDDDIQ